MPDDTKPADEAQNGAVPPVGNPPIAGDASATPPEEKATEGQAQSAAVPDEGKGSEADLQNRVKSIQGLLTAVQKERDADKKTISTLTERLEAAEKDLEDAITALSKAPAVAPDEELPPKEGKPNPLTAIVDRRKQRAAQAQQSKLSGTERFVAVVEANGFSLDDPELAEAKAAANPEEGIKIVKKLARDARDGELKKRDDQIAALTEVVTGLKNSMLKIDLSGPSGGEVPKGTPYELAVAAYSQPKKR